jgi:septum formation protein
VMGIPAAVSSGTVVVAPPQPATKETTARSDAKGLERIGEVPWQSLRQAQPLHFPGFRRRTEGSLKVSFGRSKVLFVGHTAGVLPDLVLASTSPYRRELLARLGLPFRVRAPVCDEEALKRSLRAGAGSGTHVHLPPEQLAAELARAKAESLLDLEPGAAILGSDQVVALDDHILGKPGTAEQAARQLTMLAGRTHVLCTAVALLHGGRLLAHVDVTRLAMRPLDGAQIERYVAADMPLDCAGSYRLEARGVTLFEGIASADHTAIVGLPLIAVTSMLASLGYPVP